MQTEAYKLIETVKSSLAVVVGIVLSFLMPIIPLILTVGGAIALDTITGVYRSYKTKEAITSRKLSVIVSKMLLYQLALVLFFVIETYVLQDIIGAFTSIPLILTKLVTTVLLFIELTSINENYKDISGVNVWDKFKDLLKRAKEIKSDMDNI